MQVTVDRAQRLARADPYELSPCQHAASPQVSGTPPHTRCGRQRSGHRPERRQRGRWVSRSGVLAIGIDVDEPAEETVTTSAPPSTDVLSITTNAPTVLNAVPLATRQPGRRIYS